MSLALSGVLVDLHRNGIRKWYSLDNLTVLRKSAAILSWHQPKDLSYSSSGACQSGFGRRYLAVILIPFPCYEELVHCFLEFTLYHPWCRICPMHLLFLYRCWDSIAMQYTYLWVVSFLYNINFSFVFLHECLCASLECVSNNFLCLLSYAHRLFERLVSYGLKLWIFFKYKVDMKIWLFYKMFIYYSLAFLCVLELCEVWFFFFFVFVSSKNRFR